MMKRLKYTNPYSQPFSLIYDEEVKIYKSLLPAISLIYDERLKYTNPYSQPFSLIYDEEVKIYKSLLPAIFFDLWWRG